MRNVTPSVGTGTVLPGTEPVKQKSGKSLRASKRPARRPIPHPPANPLEPETFTLELIRPAVSVPDPDRVKRLSMHQSFDAPPPGLGPEHVFAIGLEIGAPYELRFNGELKRDFAGDGWQGRPRSIVTIRATRSAGLIGVHHPVFDVHQPVANRNTHPVLLVPVSARYAVFMELDGRELVNMPAPQ